jgi:hypothetical protein
MIDENVFVFFLVLKFAILFCGMSAAVEVYLV